MMSRFCKHLQPFFPFSPAHMPTIQCEIKPEGIIVWLDNRHILHYHTEPKECWRAYGEAS